MPWSSGTVLALPNISWTTCKGNRHYWSPRRLNEDKHLKRSNTVPVANWQLSYRCMFDWKNNLFSAVNANHKREEFFSSLFFNKSHRIVWLSAEPPGFGQGSIQVTLFSEGSQLHGFEQYCCAGEYQPWVPVTWLKPCPHSHHFTIQSLLYSAAVADLLC